MVTVKLEPKYLTPSQEFTEIGAMSIKTVVFNKSICFSKAMSTDPQRLCCPHSLFLFVCSLFVIFIYPETGFYVWPCASWNSLCGSGCPDSQRYVCLYLPSAGIKGFANTVLLIFRMKSH